MTCKPTNTPQPECYQFGDMKVHRLNFLMKARENERYVQVVKRLHDDMFRVTYVKPIGGSGHHRLDYPPLPLITRLTEKEQIINAIAEHGAVRF